jgi:hypothetical protein
MEPKIVKYEMVTTPGPTGQAVQAVRVHFTVGSHGPFQEDFPKAGFSATDVKAKLAAFAQQIQQLSAQ